MRKTSRQKIEFGDYQTPLSLAIQICETLTRLEVVPQTIIEPTCGIGAFVKASSKCFSRAKKIVAVDINAVHLSHARKLACVDQRMELIHADFFRTDWEAVLERLTAPILVIGNFPWVTNSALGFIEGGNLPMKSNFHNYAGMDAITGKGNFDISEWMTIQAVDWLREEKGSFAILLKTAVARKVLSYIYQTNAPLSRSAIFKINALKEFGVATDACVLFCDFVGDLKENDCPVFETVTATKPEKVIGFRDGDLLNDIRGFDENRILNSKATVKWRSGIKHDCSKVMELAQRNKSLYNGLGERVEIEEEYVFPLLKGSDVANGRTDNLKRKVIVPQRFVGEETFKIKEAAPQTWAYLEAHEPDFTRRKSKIYKNKPKFAIFGVGDYSFADWKVAICSLYKRLLFVVVGPFEGKPVIFDDTVYFLPCRTESEAQTLCDLLNSDKSQAFFSTYIFWDSKRPITASLLSKIDIGKLASIYGKTVESAGNLPDSTLTKSEQDKKIVEQLELI